MTLPPIVVLSARSVPFSLSAVPVAIQIGPLLGPWRERRGQVGEGGPKAGKAQNGLPKPVPLSRGDWIRTSDRSAPSRVRYQTAPRPEVGLSLREKLQPNDVSATV